MSIRRVPAAFAASVVAALGFAAIATPAQADEGPTFEVRETEEVERPGGKLVGDEAFERENVIADDLLNHAEIDRSRFDDGHWHPRHDVAQEPATVNTQNN